MDWARILWWSLVVVLFLEIGIGLPAAGILAMRSGCLSVPDNTWTFPIECHLSSKGGPQKP